MHTDLLIIGAGPAGLCHAFWRKQADPNLDIRILDRAPRPGGWVETRRVEGFSCEIGPQSFRPSEESDALIAALGMEDRVLPCGESAKLRYVARDGRLHELPMGPKGLISTRLLGPIGKVRVLTELFRKSKSPPGETLAEFVRRHFGRQAVPLAEAMAAGVFGGDAHHIEIAAAFPKIVEMEQQHGSLFKAMGAMAKANKAIGAKPRPALCTFKAGMEELMQTLRRELEPHLVLGWEVARLRFVRDRWTAFLAGDSTTTITADEVVVAVPANIAALLLPDVDAELAQELRAIPFANIANIYLGYWSNEVRDRLEGFGFLIDRKESLPYLGAIYASSVFPDRAMEGKFLVRMLAGGALHPRLLDLDEETIADEAEKVLRRYTGLTAQPVFKRVYKLHQAIPQYVEGHLDRVRRIEERVAGHPRLQLIGNSYRDISTVGQMAKPEDLAKTP